MAGALTTDWNALRDSLEGGLRGMLGDLSEGIAADLDGPIREAANRLTVVVRSGKTELVAETRDQLALLFVQNKLRVKHAAMGGFLDTIIGTGINLLINGAIGGIGAVTNR